MYRPAPVRPSDHSLGRGDELGEEVELAPGDTGDYHVVLPQGLYQPLVDRDSRLRVGDVGAQSRKFILRLDEAPTHRKQDYEAQDHGRKPHQDHEPHRTFKDQAEP